MKFKFNLRREVKIITAVVIVAGIIAFTERRQGSTTITDITIKMVNINDNHFLEEDDIADLMQLDKENLKGASLAQVNLKDVEDRIRRETFIRDAQLYSDLKGNLVVRAELRRPRARLVRKDGPDGYIAEDGTIMHVSDKFTPRVMLLSGAYVDRLIKEENINETEEGANLATLLETIREHEFWSAQVAQLDIDKKMRITIYPQVGDERIEFGVPTDIDEKLRKLMIFYKEILPRVGWGKYERINLEYEGQIVTE
jgi:cell division protein FtsQ